MTQRLIQIVSLSVALLLLGGCVSGTTAYFRKLDMFDIFVDGTMRGRYPISDSIAKGVDCYRFDYDRAGKLVKIKFFRSAIFQSNYLLYGATQVRFQYSDDSQKRTFFDSNGNVIRSERLELRNNQPASISIYDDTGRLVKRHVLIRNENGQVSRIIFLNEKGERVSDNDGIYEYRFRYDNRGKNCEVRSYGADGQLKENEKSGIAITQYEHDSYGNIIEERHYGADENPKEDKIWGYALASYVYDDKGNEIEKRHYGIDGKLKVSLGGCAIWRFKYNDRGDRVEVRCYGVSEELKENKSGWAIMRSTYDYKKNRRESRYYGAKETLNENARGYAIWVTKYDSNGNLRESRFLGIDAQLKDNNEGVAIIRHEYDQEGKRTKTIYFDKSGRATKED